MQEYQITISAIATKDGHPVKNNGGGISRVVWVKSETVSDALRLATDLAIYEWGEGRVTTSRG